MFTNQQVHFRLLRCPDCSSLLCWINNRLPNFCPECGEGINRRLRSDTDRRFILLDTAEAWLRVTGRLEAVLDSEHSHLSGSEHRPAHNDASKNLLPSNHIRYNVSSRSGGDKK